MWEETTIKSKKQGGNENCKKRSNECYKKEA